MVQNGFGATPGRGWSCATCPTARCQSHSSGQTRRCCSAVVLLARSRVHHDLEGRSKTTTEETIETLGVPTRWFISLRLDLYPDPIRVVKEHLTELKRAIEAGRRLVLSFRGRAVAKLAQLHGRTFQLVARFSRISVYNPRDRAPPARTRVRCRGCGRSWTTPGRRGWRAG